VNNKSYHKIVKTSIEEELEGSKQYRFLLHPVMLASICLTTSKIR